MYIGKWIKNDYDLSIDIKNNNFTFFIFFDGKSISIHKFNRVQVNRYSAWYCIDTVIIWYGILNYNTLKKFDIEIKWIYIL